MTLKIDIRADTREVDAALAAMYQRHVPRATYLALNRALAAMETIARRDLAKHTGILNAAVRTSLSRRKASAKSPWIRLRVRDRHRNLAGFRARENKTGVSAAPWAKRRTFVGAFLGNQGRTVFRRAGRARLPIVPMWGPNLAREWERLELDQKLGRVGRETFARRYVHELRRLFAARR